MARNESPLTVDESRIIITECPVCGEDFTFVTPKFLPRCAHVICRQCLLSWLRTRGPDASCPLCRVPVLDSPCSHPDDLEPALEALPTDFAAAAVTAARYALAAQPAECGACSDVISVTSYCFQCRLKLCRTCARTHPKFPAFQAHSVQRLSELSPRRLAASAPATCDWHEGRQAELFCPAHRRPLCVLCVRDHAECGELKVMADLIAGERDRLRRQSQRFLQTGRDMTSKIRQLEKEKQDTERHFQHLRDAVTQHILVLQEALEARKQQLFSRLQQEETQLVRSQSDQLTTLKELSPLFFSHGQASERLAVTSPGGDLMEMSKKISSRWEEMEMRSKESLEMGIPLTGMLSFNVDVDDLKSRVADINFSTKPVDTLRSQRDPPEFKRRTADPETTKEPAQPDSPEDNTGQNGSKTDQADIGSIGLVRSEETNPKVVSATPTGQFGGAIETENASKKTRQSSAAVLTGTEAGRGGRGKQEAISEEGSQRHGTYHLLAHSPPETSAEESLAPSAVRDFGNHPPLPSSPPDAARAAGSKTPVSSSSEDVFEKVDMAASGPPVTHSTLGAISKHFVTMVADLFNREDGHQTATSRSPDPMEERGACSHGESDPIKKESRGEEDYRPSCTASRKREILLIPRPRSRQTFGVRWSMRERTLDNDDDSKSFLTNSDNSGSSLQGQNSGTPQLRRTQSIGEIFSVSSLQNKAADENSPPSLDETPFIGHSPSSMAHIVSVGSRVRRGRDWSMFTDDVDGGRGGTGMVLKLGQGDHPRGKGWILVLWVTTNRRKWHRMGAEGCYDLKVL